MLRVSNQGFLSQSQAIVRLLEQIESMAATDMTVLVQGETGVGKGVLARLLHNLSPRQANPFIPINCGGLSAGLIESELFGHEKGAFTSANARKIGYFERADGGTLFLDEVGDLPLEAFLKFLFGIDSFAHQMDHRDVYKCLTIAGQALVIFGMDSIIEYPSKGSFDDPTTGYHRKAGALFGHDFEVYFVRFFCAATHCLRALPRYHPSTHNLRSRCTLGEK